MATGLGRTLKVLLESRAARLTGTATLLVGLAWLSAGCGPSGVRRVRLLDAATEDEVDAAPEETGGTGGRTMTGGTGGEVTGGTGGGGTGGNGDTGGTGGTAGTGGTGGADVPPDAAAGTGGRDASPDRAPDVMLSPDAPQTCVMATAGMFVNTPMASQTGTFTAEFDAKPGASPTNALVGFSMGAQTAFTGFATSVRFNSMGMIDALNVTPYEAATPIPYMANVSYHFRVVVNVASHTYSAYVTPPGGSELTIGTSFAFRTAQNGVAALSSWALVVNTGSAGTTTACGFFVH
jgi:hypothetical protein